MTQVTIEEIFSGPWGIVSHRRGDLERAPFNKWQKIYEEELRRNFLRVEEVAGFLDCSPSTARRRLYAAKARYIVQKTCHLYLRSDVERLRPEKTKGSGGKEITQ